MSSASICWAIVLGIWFCARSSLIVPFCPSALEPLSPQMYRTIVLSRMPSSSRPSISRPAWASACSTNPAKTSISRRWKGRSLSGMLSHEAIVSARGVSSASGRNPAKFFLALEDALAHLVPAVVELSFVLVGPLLEDLVRAVTRARRPIDERTAYRARTSGAASSRSAPGRPGLKSGDTFDREEVRWH